MSAKNNSAIKNGEAIATALMHAQVLGTEMPTVQLEYKRGGGQKLLAYATFDVRWIRSGLGAQKFEVSKSTSFGRTTFGTNEARASPREVLALCSQWSDGGTLVRVQVVCGGRLQLTATGCHATCAPSVFWALTAANKNRSNAQRVAERAALGAIARMF